MKTKHATAQLELSLPNQRTCRSRRRPPRRPARASFWFERMRQVVERAADWPALPSNKVVPTP